MMAPTNADRITYASTILGSIMPVPIVLATLSLKNMKATKLKKAAHNTAIYGLSTRVETIVAIELAESWVILGVDRFVYGHRHH